jgi:myo-inositol-1(or 4)-monophosphatase
VRELSEAVISIGDFAGHGAAAKNRVRLELMRRLGARAQRIRLIGSAAIDLA